MFLYRHRRAPKVEMACCWRYIKLETINMAIACLANFPVNAFIFNLAYLG